VLAYGDGWFPQWTEENLFDRIDELRARAERPLQIQVMSAPADPKALERLDALGVDRALAWLPSGPWSVVEPVLEKWERAIGELTGS
jgi:hypothetical protein